MAQDPKPQPPAPPGPDDCCHSGCTWCVLDLYQEDLDRYQKALAEWEARQTAAQPAAKQPRRTPKR